MAYVQAISEIDVGGIVEFSEYAGVIVDFGGVVTPKTLGKSWP